MKALKILVYTMGAMLIVGIGVLVWGIATRAHVKSPPPEAAAPAAQLAPVGQPFGSIEVPLPPGGRVEQVVSAGALVVVRVSVGTDERLVVLDPVSGQVRGDFRLDAAQR